MKGMPTTEAQRSSSTPASASGRQGIVGMLCRLRCRFTRNLLE